MKVVVEKQGEMVDYLDYLESIDPANNLAPVRSMLDGVVATAPAPVSFAKTFTNKAGKQVSIALEIQFPVK